MSAYAYKDTLDSVADIVSHLTPDERVRLLEDLERIIRFQGKPTPRHKMTEFEGIAEDFWKDIDVQQFLEEERNSWDG